MVVRASPVPLYVQIEEELRGMIVSGNLQPMARVPSEAELSKEFRVSRMTARKALDRLVGDGLLFRKAGKGTFVATPKISHEPSNRLSFSAAMRALGLPRATRVLERGMVPAPSNVAIALGVPTGTPVVYIRRLRLVGREPVALHLSYLPAAFAILLERDLSGSLYDLMAGIGARVELARDAIEAVAASGDEARLLKVDVGAPLIFIAGVASSVSQEPLRYTEALYRGDRFRFGVDSTGRPDLRLELKAADADGNGTA